MPRFDDSDFDTFDFSTPLHRQPLFLHLRYFTNYRATLAPLLPAHPLPCPRLAAKASSGTRLEVDIQDAEIMMVARA